MPTEDLQSTWKLLAPFKAGWDDETLIFELEEPGLGTNSATEH